MKIDCMKVTAYSQSVEKIYRLYSEQKDMIKQQRLRLCTNTNLDLITEELRKCEEKIDEHLETLSRISLAVSKIADLYAACEKKIENHCESHWQPDKIGFTDVLDTSIISGISWRID